MEASSVRFRASEGMVAKFAALTGDRSALHVSSGFARRSIYRQPVVHGMLPLMFLPFVAGLRIEGHLCVLNAISGRFINPVHLGDVLELRLAPAAEPRAGDEFLLDYEVDSLAGHTAVTKGSIAVTYRRGQARSRTPRPGEELACLVTRPLEGLTLASADVAAGRSELIEFSVTDAAIQALHALTAEGLIDERGLDAAAKPHEFHYANLLTTTLLSTLVGMRLPGHSATFLEFTVRLPRAVELNSALRLEGVVAHASRATRIIKTNVCVSECRGQQHDAVLTGKVSALVNPPPPQMPPLLAMKRDALDPGLREKVVLVTGASRGIGETTAKLFALHGARVVVNYHRGKDDAGRIVEEIRSAGGDAMAAQADVTDREQVRRMVAAAADRFGPIRVLVNNAVRDYRAIPFLNLTWDEIQLDLDVIAKGAFHCCQEVIPLMLGAGGGKIVNISTLAVENPPADQAKYVLAKSALVGLTRSLSIEFAARNIQVNLVVPNFVETDLVARIPDSFRRKIAQDTAMQRHASALEVAQAVLFLASAHASFTTGQKILVTGGGAPYL
jgi:3-oxoacyl-[acyl-carrier protein] reductase